MSISVRELISCLQKMESGAGKSGGKRKRNRGRRSASGPTPGTSGSFMVQPLLPTSGKKRRRKRKGSGGTPQASLASGEVVVSRSECLGRIATAAAASRGGSFVLCAESLPWLANLAKAFERLRWQSMRLEYRPAVGANTDGLMALGFDWSNSSVKAVQQDGRAFLSLAADPSRDGVLACTPNADGPVWQRMPLMSIPAQRLNSRAWYSIPEDATKADLFDYSPGSLVYFVDGAASKNYGEVWCHYKVTLSGTRKV